MVPATLSARERELFEELAKVSDVRSEETAMTTYSHGSYRASHGAAVRLSLDASPRPAGLHPQLIRPLRRAGTA